MSTTPKPRKARRVVLAQGRVGISGIWSPHFQECISWPDIRRMLNDLYQRRIRLVVEVLPDPPKAKR